MTSEQILELSPQPENTCSEIDKGITHIKQAISDANDIEKEVGREFEISDITYLASSIDYALYDVEDIFEHCRSQLEELRNWGQEWKDLTKELLQEYDPTRLGDE